MILHRVILSLLFLFFKWCKERRGRPDILHWALRQWSLTALCLFLSDSAMPLFKAKKERHLMGSDKLPQILPLSEQLSTMHTQRIWVFYWQIPRLAAWPFKFLLCVFTFLLTCLSLARNVVSFTYLHLCTYMSASLRDNSLPMASAAEENWLGMPPLVEFLLRHRQTGERWQGVEDKLIDL